MLSLGMNTLCVSRKESEQSYSSSSSSWLKKKKKKTFLLCCNKTEARGNRGQYNSVNHCMKYAFAVL